MSEALDCVVVGAGVIGLAAGRALASDGHEVVVLEAEGRPGMHASSRNSEVIHAGLYYPEDSLKARLCVRGRRQLYAYCKERHIGYQRLGKLIVATDDADLEKLRAISEQANKNGVTDLDLLSARAVQELEPQVSCTAGLLSPSTGIIDSHELMTALLADIEARQGVLVCNTEVSDISFDGGIFHFRGAGETFTCTSLVNAAGAWAQGLAPMGVGPQSTAPARFLAKGHYFDYRGKSPFRHLVYPLPAHGGLGIHATNDLSGAARFGPDVDWVEEIDYRFDDERKQAFVSAIRQYYPGLEVDRLSPGYTGIRSKVAGPGDNFADFIIHGPREHGIPGLVNLFGIDSPGLTASLAIGDYVKQLIK